MIPLLGISRILNRIQYNGFLYDGEGAQITGKYYTTNDFVDKKILQRFLKEMEPYMTGNRLYPKEKKIMEDLKDFYLSNFPLIIKDDSLDIFIERPKEKKNKKKLDIFDCSPAEFNKLTNLRSQKSRIRACKNKDKDINILPNRIGYNDLFKSSRKNKKLTINDCTPEVFNTRNIKHEQVLREKACNRMGINITYGKNGYIYELPYANK